ncbi:MAG: hypothetical protein IKR27_00450 [Lachnospiraceae bacterium]|nr:hypothetical protein [Lachnospiraceae bacterium]
MLKDEMFILYLLDKIEEQKITNEDGLNRFGEIMRQHVDEACGEYAADKGWDYEGEC